MACCARAGFLGLLALALWAPAPACAADADADGKPDGTDNCAYAANPSQADTGGVGPGSAPDGVGDACQCGDANGDGRVTSEDAGAISRWLRAPRENPLARPALCDVGGPLGCGPDDAAALALALAKPGSASLGEQCHAPRTIVVQGDTQTLTRAAGFAALWEETQQRICAAKRGRNIDFVLATGDIVEQFGMASLVEVARADAAYDILDACGLGQALPGGNHDTNCSYQGCPAPPLDWSHYTSFLRNRPLHRPAQQSESGLSFAGRLFYDVWFLALPFAADLHEEAWARRLLGSAPGDRRFWLIEHDAVLTEAALNPARAAGRLAARDPLRVLGVIGGHFIPGPGARRWRLSALASGQLALFSNYQELDPQTRPAEPFTEVTLLEYQPISRRWCARDFDFLSDARDRFGPRQCF
jgi:hypothetical protein